MLAAHPQLQADRRWRGPDPSGWRPDPRILPTHSPPYAGLQRRRGKNAVWPQASKTARNIGKATRDVDVGGTMVGRLSDPSDPLAPSPSWLPPPWASAARRVRGLAGVLR